jgi:hypothetical protein
MEVHHQALVQVLMAASPVSLDSLEGQHSPSHLGPVDPSAVAEDAVGSARLIRTRYSSK